MRLYRKKFFGVIFLSAIGIFIAVYFYYGADEYAVSISHQSGIYEDAFELIVRAGSPGTCYYTTDGTVPSPESDSAYIYDGPLWLTPLDETKVYSYQFLYIFDDGTSSDVITRDFILDKNASSRFTTTYIISVSGDEDDLFSYEDGIFVRGQVFDDYMANNPDANLLTTVVPANYYSENELPVHTAIFSTNGALLLDQNCGLKIYGNVTRAKNQKSFRLIARYAYDTRNEFSYPFFSKLYSDKTNTQIQNFQRLSVHNSGNDNYYAFMRNTLIGELARQAGFPDVLVSESATVYVNGQYQGIYWLQNTFDDRYFSEKYGEYLGEVIVCEGTLNKMDSTLAETDSELLFAEDYNRFVASLTSANMSDESTWELTKRTIDINNFALYMAIEYYINNIDWPNNNVKIYRYLQSNEDVYESETIFDGKYRFLLFDTDYGLGLKFLDFFGYDAYQKRLADFMSEDNTITMLFRKLMERPEFKELFINNVLVLMSQSFSPENIEAQMHDFNGKRYSELEFMINQTNLMYGDLWEDEPLTTDHVWQEMNEIVRFAQKRPSIVIEELQEVLDCGVAIPISVRTNENYSFVLNDMNIGHEYSGTCFENVPLTLNCQVSGGVKVLGYYINETYIEGAVARILPADYLGDYNAICIEPVFEIIDVAALSIHAYQTDGTQDYVVIQNTGTLPVQLADYAISDDESKPTRSQLPRYTLAPREEFYVYGKGYTGTMYEPYCRVTFSWNSEESVILSDEFGYIVDKK